jgi:hypothetical protein
VVSLSGVRWGGLRLRMTDVDKAMRACA